MLPSQLSSIPDGLILSSVATDTETSGLFADDGARISTASIAFQIPMGKNIEGMTCRVEEIAPDYHIKIASMAWPFDQGLVPGKPEYHGQDSLWPDAENLPVEEFEALLEWLAGQNLDMHHGKFDLEKYRVGCRPWPGVGRDLQANLVWDTQNVNWLLWPLLKDPTTFKPTTSLKPSCMVKFGRDFGDESAKVRAYLKKSKLPPGRWDLIPWEIIGDYADMDSRLTCMLKLRQIWEIENEGAGAWLYEKMTEEDWADRERLGLNNADVVYDAINRRLDTSFVLYHMEWKGLPYDEAESRLAAMECTERAAILAKDLPFRPTDMQAKKFFFEDGRTDKGAECLNMIPYEVTDKGNPSLTAEILERMVEDEIPYAGDWLKWNKVANAESMWYTGYADKMGTDARLRCAFRQNSVVSHRFSVERVNLQAIPQNYRLENFEILDGIATPRQLIASAVAKMGGWRIFELDLAQAELRVAAMFAECTPMLDMIHAGEDLHTYTTKALFDVGPDDPRFGQYRQVGKRGNFSLIFGSQWLTFSRMVSKETGIRLPEHEARRIVREWNALYPDFARAIDRHSTAVAKRQAKYGQGWITLLNGERRWFDKYEETHKAFNQRVQPNLAQFGIDWMLKSDQFLDREGYGVKNGAGLVLTIHDSQVLLLPDNKEGEELAEVCAGFGRDLWKRTFDVPGDVDYHAW